MKKTMISIAALAMVGWFLTDIGLAQRGGRGGGGRGGGGGGGGGGFRGGAPSGGFSGGGRPSSGMSRPTGGGGSHGPSSSGPGGGRPSVGGGTGAGIGGGVGPGGGSGAVSGAASRPGISGRPGGGTAGVGSPGAGTRPGVGSGGAGAGTRPGVGAGTLPGLGAGNPGVGTRPGAGAGAPGVGTRPGAGAGAPGVGTRPGAGAGAPGLGTRPGAGVGAPGISARPGTLPGFGDAGRPERLPARDGSVQDRRQGLQDGLANRRENIGSGTENRQDWREGNREDWQDSWHDNHWGHGWYNGCWHGGYYPGNWWGVASWTTPWWGSWWYSNPYAIADSSVTYNYSEPIVVYQAAPESSQVTATTQPLTSQPPAAKPEVTQAFDAAREAFAGGDYKKALDQINTVIKATPNDIVAHEFHGLVLFALKDYRAAAAVDYAVLSAGPGWDWTTLSSLYSDTSEYEKQLRALEDYVGKNPKSADGHFLLAYHYMTTGHVDNAADQLKQVNQLQPNDKLASDLLKLVTPEDEQPAPSKPEATAKAIPSDQVVGSWTASGTGNSRFDMTLDKDGKFTWKYTRGKNTQEVKGVYAIDQATLALQPDTGGSMLADLSLDGGKLSFQMAGGDASDPALQFSKSKS